LTKGEDELIQIDLSARIFRLINLHPNFASDIMQKGFLPSIGAAYWRKKIPGGLWRIPYSMLHPRASLKHLKRKLEKLFE
jgi:hypothetical protein